jgi:tetratricopeptide (TPR) repeat protein
MKRRTNILGFAGAVALAFFALLSTTSCADRREVGDLSNAGGASLETREYYEQALEIAKNLASRSPDDAQALSNLSASYNGLGDLAYAEGSCQEAREYYEQALEIKKNVSLALLTTLKR